MSGSMAINGFSQQVLRLEEAIRAGRSEIESARAILRNILISECSNHSGGMSIGDALDQLAVQPIKSERSVILLLRCLSEPGLMPESNNNNNIIRLTVDLCESAIPNILSFVKWDGKAQNYLKFQKLQTVHGEIKKLLSPITVGHGNLEGLVQAQRQTVGVLNHSIVKEYCDIFGLDDVRATMERVYYFISKVCTLDTSLLTSVEDSKLLIVSALDELNKSGTFLHLEFLKPFLINSNHLLDEFLESNQGGFLAAISWAGSRNQQLQKRQPLSEAGREIQLQLPFRNKGPGMATAVTVSVTEGSGQVVLGGETISLGNVLPGEFSVAIDAMIVEACERFTGLASVEWGVIGSPRRLSEIFEFTVLAQSASIDWTDQEQRSPYSTEVAEGEEFVGRVDKIVNISAKLLRSKMESLYITGQKRVGKTSLALAAAEYARKQYLNNAFHVHYILWGEVVHADPNVAVQNLGESIDNFIVDNLRSPVSYQPADYRGSLAPLMKLVDYAEKDNPDRRFVIIIDEFDEIHQELFLHGNLAETFFGNLRALSRKKNICLVLIGGENMPFIMDRQGQKLNNFSRVNLSYYSRDAEWDDFQLLVRHPTAGLLNWHEEAVSEIFNVTNGNPYFAKIVCASIFRFAVQQRDADITEAEVRRATESEISILGANSFAHLWQDGVPKAAAEREPDILLRMRALVALARCHRSWQNATLANIFEHKASAKLNLEELGAVLNDFVRRDVLNEEQKEYRVTLPIFRKWLVDVGVSQLIADSLSEELANTAVEAENAALIRSDEIVNLVGQWPTYRGRQIGTDDVRAWMQQVRSQIDQRILFKLLSRTRVFSEAQIRERLGHAHNIIRKALPDFVMRSRGERRHDVLVTYIDGEGKSGASYAALYAEENGIAATCVVSPSSFRDRLEGHRSQFGDRTAIVMIDDVAATGGSLIKNLKKFFEEFDKLVSGWPIRIVTLVGTEESQTSVGKYINSLKEDIEFRSCEILPEDAFAFPKTAVVWDSPEEEARARALCMDLGSQIYRANPLGYGNMGMLLVLPTTVPNNSLPILHSHSRAASKETWKPLFPRVVN